MIFIQYLLNKSDKSISDYVSVQEYILQKEAKEKENIELTFSYENSNGEN